MYSSIFNIWIWTKIQVNIRLSSLNIYNLPTNCHDIHSLMYQRYINSIYYVFPFWIGTTTTCWYPELLSLNEARVQFIGVVWSKSSQSASSNEWLQQLVTKAGISPHHLSLVYWKGEGEKRGSTEVKRGKEGRQKERKVGRQGRAGQWVILGRDR